MKEFADVQIPAMVEHTGWSLLLLYIANVVASYAIFADALLLAVLLPF